MCGCGLSRYTARGAMLFFVALSILASVSLSEVAVVDATVPHTDIYFNKTNALFQPNNGGANSNRPTITVGTNWNLNIYCPHYPQIANNVETAMGDESYEQYKLFMFNEKERHHYDNCDYPPDAWELKDDIKWIGKGCQLDPVHSHIAIKVIPFIGFGSSPWSFQYKPGNYYVTSFSTGRPGGYNNTNKLNSACSTHNMGFKVVVEAAGTNGQAPASPTTTTTTPQPSAGGSLGTSAIITKITDSIANGQGSSLGGGTTIEGGDVPSSTHVAGAKSTEHTISDQVEFNHAPPRTTLSWSLLFVTILSATWLLW